MDDHADDVHRWLGGTDGNEFDNRLDHRLDILQQKTDDNRWYHELPDARVRKFTLLGPPIPNTDVELEIPTYAFFPGDSSSDDDTASSRPAIVLVHGGIHDNFSTKYVSVVRELLDEGYVVVSPEYRGSTGYGREHYEAIDYGGHEIADTLAARNWAADRAEVDDERIGVVGWSHGGLHALLSVFRYPDSYAVAYAGAPVSDLLERWKYKDEGYHRLYTANYHLGTTPDADPDRYRKRSPAHQAVATGTPLRIHATTNDGDVHHSEVESLVESLRDVGAEFEYECYDDAPGGHDFELNESRFARDSRQRVYDFLADHLSPPHRDSTVHP